VKGARIPGKDSSFLPRRWIFRHCAELIFNSNFDLALVPSFFPRSTLLSSPRIKTPFSSSEFDTFMGLPASPGRAVHPSRRSSPLLSPSLCPNFAVWRGRCARQRVTFGNLVPPRRKSNLTPLSPSSFSFAGPERQFADPPMTAL